MVKKKKERKKEKKKKLKGLCPTWTLPYCNQITRNSNRMEDNYALHIINQQPLLNLF